MTWYAITFLVYNLTKILENINSIIAITTLPNSVCKEQANVYVDGDTLLHELHNITTYRYFYNGNYAIKHVNKKKRHPATRHVAPHSTLIL